MSEKQFKKGDVIFREGDEGKSFYDILEGTVGIFVGYNTDSEEKLTELKPGQFFGEMAVIDAYPRSATAVALDDVKVSEVSSGEMDGYFETQPDRIVAIMKHLSSRIRILSNDYSEVTKAIQAFGKNKEASADRLINKLRKFANTYKHNKSITTLDSAEAKRKIAEASHSEGYTEKVESYSKGTIIFKEGEKGNCLYDVHFGEVGIYTGYGTPDEKLLTRIGTNRFFGEMGMLDDDIRSATAVALSDETTVEIITADDLNELFKKNAPKVGMILAHLSYRLRSLTISCIDACKLASDVTEAEASGSVSEDLRKKADSFEAKFYA